MQDYGLYRNSEGYSDPTAAEAIKGMAKPGEIWKYKGREVLIVKNQGAYSNILTLSTILGKDKTAIEVAGRYTTPGKLNYAFNERLGAMVERITPEELKAVLMAIEDSLHLDIYAEFKPPVKEATVPFVETAVNKDFEAENKALKKKYSLLRSMYDDLLDKFIENFGRV